MLPILIGCSIFTLGLCGIFLVYIVKNETKFYAKYINKIEKNKGSFPKSYEYPLGITAVGIFIMLFSWFFGF